MTVVWVFDTCKGLEGLGLFRSLPFCVRAGMDGIAEGWDLVGCVHRILCQPSCLEIPLLCMRLVLDLVATNAFSETHRAAVKHYTVRHGARLCAGVYVSRGMCCIA